jgi:hypothetical protein
MIIKADKRALGADPPRAAPPDDLFYPRAPSPTNALGKRTGIDVVPLGALYFGLVGDDHRSLSCLIALRPIQSQCVCCLCPSLGYGLLSRISWPSRLIRLLQLTITVFILLVALRAIIEFPELARCRSAVFVPCLCFAFISASIVISLHF